MLANQKSYPKKTSLNEKRAEYGQKIIVSVSRQLTMNMKIVLMKKTYEE